MKIRLQTRDGQFVAENEILPFQVLPEIVLWGERFFTLFNLHGEKPEDSNQVPVYREAFCFVIIDIQGENDGTGN